MQHTIEHKKENENKEASAQLEGNRSASAEAELTLPSFSGAAIRLRLESSNSLLTARMTNRGHDASVQEATAPRLPESHISHRAAAARAAMNRLSLPRGLTVISGGSGIGKTPLLRAWARALGVGIELNEDSRYIRHGEPFAGYSWLDEDFILKMGLAVQQCRLLDEGSRFIAIDSLKDALNASGNAMKGGLSRGALRFLSALSITLASERVRGIAVINPSSSDASVIGEFTEAVKSSVNGFVWMKADGRVSVELRGEEARPRASIELAGPPFEISAVVPTYGRRSGSSVYEVETRTVDSDFGPLSRSLF